MLSEPTCWTGRKMRVYLSENQNFVVIYINEIVRRLKLKDKINDN